MALAMPPPSSPTCLGSLVKKSQFSAFPPCHTRYPRMKNRTETASRVHTPVRDRKSTRLNSSHSQISYAVFCLKKKKNNQHLKTLNDTYVLHSTYKDVSKSLEIR